MHLRVVHGLLALQLSFLMCSCGGAAEVAACAALTISVQFLLPGASSALVAVAVVLQWVAKSAATVASLLPIQAYAACACAWPLRCTTCWYC